MVYTCRYPIRQAARSTALLTGRTGLWLLVRVQRMLESLDKLLLHLLPATTTILTCERQLSLPRIARRFFTKPLKYCHLRKVMAGEGRLSSLLAVAGESTIYA